ncbi:single-stranded DNA-binding protein [Brachybacterium paraconglomeratum]|uniref:single-stranded DNA-binding protein n=1 Tax=Brachybacterium paraconglomeratum TaxID=173362 RepID=UPI0024905C55|nr:single-stranded DNA-binding protein [Brachybacterium paraconglomeratum]
MDRFTAFEGNLAADPELKEFEDGNASVRFRLINNPTRTDRRTGEVIKETPIGQSCIARDPFARTIAANAKKGTRLLVWGALKAREYTDRDGNRRTAEYLDVKAVGESWRFLKSSPQATETPAPSEEAAPPWPEAAQPGSGFAG